MRHFKEITDGKVVIMGRKTFESLPNKKPLSNRRNIILTRREDYQVDNTEVVHNVDELMSLLIGVNGDDIFVIGGEEIYRLLMPYCDTVYVTKVFSEPQAHSYFPNIESVHGFKITESSEIMIDDSDNYKARGIRFQFLTYTR